MKPREMAQARKARIKRLCMLEVGGKYFWNRMTPSQRKKKHAAVKAALLAMEQALALEKAEGA